MKKANGYKNLLLLLAVISFGCSPDTSQLKMYPDYREVTIPCNIAPLNFYYSGSGTAGAVTIFEADGVTVKVRGRNVCIPPEKWKLLTTSARGSAINVSSTVSGKWKIQVSDCPIDSYLTYRLIEPGYEVWNCVEIIERDVTSFDERVLSSWKDTENACMNCHIHKGDNTLFYLRGDKGGAILSRNGDIRKLDLRREGMVSGTVYGDLHPGGQWGVFSTNIIIPGFHTAPGKRLEVFDTASHLCVADFDSNRLLTPVSFTCQDRLETFPCFSADGLSVFYCAADTVTIPEDITSLKYSLMKTSFDPDTGELGSESVILWDASEHNGSVCHPKASPDGRWLVFTVADYGTFPIWHRECDLWIMDLNTGDSRPLAEANSPDFSDSYHSWSSEGRWITFASKRDDGQYGKPYFCFVNDDGTATKPFLLPQRDPHFYDRNLKSFNIPDIGKTPAPYDSRIIGNIRRSTSAEVFH